MSETEQDMQTNLKLTIAHAASALEEHAGLAGTDVLLFPELVDGGYARLRRDTTPRGDHNPEVEVFRKASAQLQCTVVGGSLPLRTGKHGMTNTSLVFSRGRRIHRYDKIHLFRPCNDHIYFHPGKEIKTFSFLSAAGRVKGGVVICFDLRFPELIRLLALQGMQVLFVPARWPQVRDDAWRTLLKARAIENQIFVAGCNARGEEGGYSYVFDPFGNEVLSDRLSPETLVQTVELDLGKIDEAHRLHRNIREAVVLRKLRAGKRG